MNLKNKAPQFNQIKILFSYQGNKYEIVPTHVVQKMQLNKVKPIHSQPVFADQFLFAYKVNSSVLKEFK